MTKKIFILPVIAFLLLSFSFCKNGNDINRRQSEGMHISKDSLKQTDILNPENKFKDIASDCYKLHYDAIVVDAHNDYIYQVYKRGANFNRKDNNTQTGLDRLIEGGIKLQVFSLWTDSENMKRAYKFTQDQIDRFKKIEAENSDRFKFANSYDDMISIIQSGKLCGLMSIEGGNPVENDLDRINEFYKQGVRYIGLTWNNSNKIGTSAKDESGKNIKGGLTEYGYEVIKRMDEVGMMIDVSHAGEQTFWDVLKTTKNPIIASHSNCYSLCGHYRNLTDEQINAIGENDGIIMMNFYDAFIDINADAIRTKNAYEKYSKELKEIYDANSGDMIKFNQEREIFLSSKDLSGGIPLDRLIDHIDYIYKLIGADHIGLGSDFDGGITPPNELYDGTCYPLITKKLAERGYSELEIRKILGLNFLRVFKQVCG
ncbi:MAG: dipeptidase [Ignavibacteria bacterium]|jgi:membrane dipeptidase